MKWKKIVGFELIINEDDYQSFYIDKSEENYQLCGITKNDTENILCKGTYGEIKKAFDSMINTLEEKDDISKKGTGQFVLTKLEYDVLNYAYNVSKEYDYHYFFEIGILKDLQDKGHFAGIPKNCPYPIQTILSNNSITKLNIDENTYLMKRCTCYRDKIYNFTLKIPEENLDIIKKYLILLLQNMDTIEYKESLENKTVYGLLSLLNEKANELIFVEEFGMFGNFRPKDMTKK